MRETSFDVVTIGAGGGAYPAAFRLARAGMKVLMTDPKGMMSGNCLAEGCVPSKAVREIAHHWERHQRFSEFGITSPGTVDYHRVVAHKDTVQRKRYAQHATELSSAPNITLLKGEARFTDPNTVVVETEGGTQRFRARHIIIASGADVVIPKIPGADLCLTSRDLYKLDPGLKQLPSSLVVIGGGYIGLETASFFAAFGTNVTLLQRGPRVLAGMDSDIVNTLLPLLHPRIKIIPNAEVLGVEKNTGGLAVNFRVEGAAKRIEAPVILSAVGRHPVIPEGVSALGLEIDRRGIVVRETMQTGIPNIYACGDVNGKLPLFHAAVRQALVAAHNILSGDVPCDYMDFESVPTTIFTLPSAAYVGVTPDLAKTRGIRLMKGAYEFREDSRAQILREPGGGIRLFFEPGSLRLLGGWVVGVDAENLIGEIGQAVANGLTARQIAAFADQHPMASEGISKAARSLF